MVVVKWYVGGRKPLDIIDSMTRKAVDRWLYVLPNREQVQVVTMDMWRPYRDSVRAILPQAKIVVDKFHVIAPVGMALDKVRNRARRGGATPRKNPRTGKVLLQTSRHNLTPMRRMLLDGILANSPLISAAWHAKEAFYDIWEADTRSAAEIAYDKWRAAMPSEIAPEFNPVVGMINNWREEVFAYFDHPVTNAYTEAANGIIKVANRAGRGYEFANIRAKALLRPSPKTRNCEFCKDEYPASSLQKIDLRLPHWDEDEVVVKKACGNCHYVFHTICLPHFAATAAELSTSKSE